MLREPSIRCAKAAFARGAAAAGLGAILCAGAARPADAWTFSRVPVCTLASSAGPAVKVTFDGAVYAIHLTRPEGWPPAPVFAIRFEGPAGRTISTDRHVIAGKVLSVTDRGFGNVLDGMQFNARAVALLGDLSVPFTLEGAAEPVARFRGCPDATGV